MQVQTRGATQPANPVAKQSLSSPHLVAVDGLRGVAVLMVLVQHGGFLKNDFGARGVEIFFVVSGFCLSLPYFRANKRFASSAFISARAWRLLPSYWLALALCVLLGPCAWLDPTSHITTWSIFQNVTLLPMISSPYNAAFWTLGLEARWYFLFPILLGLFRFNTIYFYLFGLALYALHASNISAQTPDLATLPCFMLGIIAAHLFINNFPSQRFIFLLGLAVAFAATFFRDRPLDHGDPLWHLVAFTLVLATLGPAGRLLSWRPLVLVGNASYSIYLLNMPVLLTLQHIFGAVPISYALGTVASIQAGIVFWYLIERNITRGNFLFLMKRLSSSKPASLTTAYWRSLFRKHGSY